MISMKNPFSKKAYEDRKAAKIQQKLTEKKAFQTKKIQEQIEAAKKNTRKPAEIEREYNVTSAKLGDAKYRSFVLEKEVEQYIMQLRQFNDEFMRAAQIWPEEAKAMSQRNVTEPVTPTKGTDVAPSTNDPATQVTGSPIEGNEGAGDAELA